MCSRAFLAPKMAIFGPKPQLLKLRSATCESRSRPPPLSFWLILCVIVPHTHRYHPPKFQPNLKHHDGVLIFTHFARAAVSCYVGAEFDQRGSPSPMLVWPKYHKIGGVLIAGTLHFSHPNGGGVGSHSFTFLLSPRSGRSVIVMYICSR